MLKPYTDTTLYPIFDISTVPVCNHFILGFVVADDDKQASWGGYYPMTDDYYGSIIKNVRKKGGDVTCSFGGAAGQELATVIKNVDELALKYMDVIKQYKFKSVDFDIEGSQIKDHKANERRGHALLKIANALPKLKISLTVPVMPSGLDQDALKLIEITPCDLVNIMAMDFGNEKDMGAAVIKSIKATRSQIKKDLGVTVMIGENDTGEVFTLEDAKRLKKFVAENSYVKMISFWAIERDQGKSGSLDKSSKIKQLPWEFTNILK